MFRINTILVLFFTSFYMFFGFNIISLKKAEHNKLLNLQIIKEISDLDFKVQLIEEEIEQIKQTKEFALYLEDQNSHLKVYHFHQKMKKLFNIFGNLPLDNYMNLGFYNSNNNYLIYSSYDSTSRFFFKNKKIDIQAIISENKTHYIKDNTLFLFKKIENQNILWFISIDLRKNFPVLFNKNAANFRLSDRKNEIIFESGQFNIKPKTYQSLTLGNFKYEISNRLSKDETYIVALIILVYIQILLVLYFFNKYLRKAIVIRIQKSLEMKNSPNYAINDITLEINKIMTEKKEVEFMYRNYSKSYQNLLLKEYLMGLSTDLSDLKSLFQEFNCFIKIILIPHDVSTNDKEKLYLKMQNLEDCLFASFLSGIDIIIIKEETYEKIKLLIEEVGFLTFVSRTYENLISIKGEWKELSNNYNKYTLMESKDNLGEPISSAEKDKQDKMIKFLENNYQNDISLFDLSEVISETPKYTSFLFKKYTRVNFKEALTTYRINEAKRLVIENPNIKFTEVYKKVGYNSLISFTNSFKRQEKITPSAWRVKIKESKNV